jgi:hypothetical protein
MIPDNGLGTLHQAPSKPIPTKASPGFDKHHHASYAEVFEARWCNWNQ